MRLEAILFVSLVACSGGGDDTTDDTTGDTGTSGVSLEDFPKLKAHDEMMKSRPSVQKVLPLYD